MIKLTRIHGEEIIVNERNIQWIECSPDTTITFLNGAKIIVREKIDQIIDLMKEKKHDNSSSDS